jgi:hypothetical protein
MNESGKQLDQSRRIKFQDAPTSNLVIDAIYEGGTSGNLSSAVIHKLIPGMGNVGGFRYIGKHNATQLVVLFANGGDINWPDSLDEFRGTFQYYGDNRKPGKELHDTPKKGNEILRLAFANAHIDEDSRSKVPIFLIFEGTGVGHSVRFRGLAVPGDSHRNQLDDLLAVWRISNGVRFQNYRATFSILDIGDIDGNWIREIAAGKISPLQDPRAPKALKHWVKTGVAKVLQADALRVSRTTSEQQPNSSLEREIIKSIRDYCKDDDYLFEAVAAEVWKLSTSLSMSLDLTRRSRDGGRDAIGHLHLGPSDDPISIEFCLEAKHYAPANSVGVKELSRLISRIKNREFGVLVTTSFVSKQAYDEIRTDGHPIIILAGKDIASILISRGITSRIDCTKWIENIFIKP